MVQDNNDPSSQQQQPKNHRVALRLIDYKSGKMPNLKYSAATNDRIRAEKFEQLLMYALLRRESGKDRENSMPLRYLRLFYLNSDAGDADYMDYDLGATEMERDIKLHGVHLDLAKVWRDVRALVDEANNKNNNNNNWHAFVGCGDKNFCYCHKCRPRFVPGSVWEPPLSDDAAAAATAR